MTAGAKIHAGFIPLTDCAPLVVANELGFDRAHGLSFVLHRAASWANIRDMIESDVLDCAIMLAPMPLASTLGLGGRPAMPLIAPMATSLNGNAITLSRTLFDEMARLDADNARAGGMAAAKALARVVAQRRADGLEPLMLGMVHPFSCHNYDLRYWLASAGVDPDHDVNLVVIPPPLIAGSLKSGRIDGFCVGMPWNSVAVEDGDGVIVATKSQLWAASPEKVLGLKRAFAEKYDDVVIAVIRAMSEACAWLDAPENRAEAAKMLALPRYIGIPEDILRRALTDKLQRGDEFTVPLPPETVIFNRRGANFPWTSHATWILTQMIRWGQVRAPFNIGEAARRVYRPDVYRRAVANLGVAAPAEDIKREGDGAFFGAETFNPRTPISYLKRLSLRDANVDLELFTDGA
ncbi:MAG: CmpA/NrtA family ABC transporter substrate-binding protein [Hyphomicrobium sp.]